MRKRFKYTPYRELPVEYQLLLKQAEDAMQTAYNPYSNFFVGAALLSPSGDAVKGSNVENSAYGSTICAERSAIVRANAMEMRIFKAIAIIGKGKDFETKQVTAPCGSCRQMLYELFQVSGEKLDVIMSTTRKDRIIVASIEDLLPLAFGPKDVGVDIERFRN
ncbi:MAG: cytidine deaminase [Candidatus Nanoarchaeia archaeon]|jgi:cytidine deaminase